MFHHIDANKCTSFYSSSDNFKTAHIVWQIIVGFKYSLGKIKIRKEASVVTTLLRNKLKDNTAKYKKDSNNNNINPGIRCKLAYIKTVAINKCQTIYHAHASFNFLTYQQAPTSKRTKQQTKNVLYQHLG